MSIVQLLIQGTIATQHSVEQVGGSQSRGKAGRMQRVGLREGARHFQDVVPGRHLGGADIRSPQSTNIRKTRDL